MLRISLWVTVILSFVYSSSQHVIFNPTISEPLGYYFAYKSNYYNIGDKVLICLISDKHISVMNSLGLPANFNDCPHKSPFLLKTIVAKAGDVVEISESGILINGKLQDLTKSFKSFKGVNLYPLAKQKFTLSSNEFFMLGNTRNSYDSRYFGLVKKDQIYSKVVLIWQVKNG